MFVARNSRTSSPVQLVRWLVALAALALGAEGIRADGPEPAAVTAAREAVAKGQTVRTRGFGAANGAGTFSEVPSDGAVLVGFEFGVGKFGRSDVVYTIRPVFLTAYGEAYGTQRGQASTRSGNRVVKRVERTEMVKAPKGYAVGKVVGRSGLAIDSITVTFYRINGASLDRNKVVTRPTVGTSTGGGEFTLDGEGGLPVGVFGSEHGMSLGMGLIVVQEPAPVRTVSPKAQSPGRKSLSDVSADELWNQLQKNIDAMDPKRTEVEADESAPGTLATWPSAVVPPSPLADTSGGGLLWITVVVFGFVSVAAFAALVVSTLVRRTGKQAEVAAAEQPTPEVEPTQAPEATPAEAFALPASERVGFGPRLGALVIDCVVIVLAGVALGIAGATLGFGAGTTLAGGLAARPGVVPAAGIFGAIMGGAIAMAFGMTLASLGFMVWEGLTGAALGKRLLKLRVRSADGRPAGVDLLLSRAAIKYSSRLLGLAGLLLGSGIFNFLAMLAAFAVFVGCFCALGVARQALHDLAIGTAVYRD